MYVVVCQICQQKKNGRSRNLETPAPLDVPTRGWDSLATDFIVKLPKSKRGFYCITAWVGRLSSRVHFLACHATGSAVNVANNFFSEIIRSHGLPDSIVSDRDAESTSKFWEHLMRHYSI